MTYKTLSVNSLLTLSLLVPSLVFAQDGNGLGLHIGASIDNKGRRMQEVRREIAPTKRKIDVRVSLVGKVTAIQGTMITLLASNGTIYTIDASAAHLTRRFGAAMNLAEIQINDQLFVQATLVGTTLKAKMIQDFSLQSRQGTFIGTIQSMTSNNLVLKTQNRGLQTVFVSSTTKILKGSTTATLAEVLVGAQIKVDGIWNSVNNNIAATKIQIMIKQEEVRLNGVVASVTGTTMTFTTDGETYTADLSKAKLVGRGYFGTDATKIKVGDIVQVWGKTMTGSLQVNASLVIDFAI